MAKAPTSYIQTTGATRTRTVDGLYFPLLGRPQAMTVYVRFIEQGSTLFASGASSLWHIGNAANNNALLQVYQSGGFYRVGYSNEVSSSAGATLAVAPAIGDTVEILVTLSLAGVAIISQSINGGTATSATATALVLPPAWSDQRFYLNTAGNQSPGIAVFRDVFIVRGIHSLATMRTRAGQ